MPRLIAPLTLALLMSSPAALAKKPKVVERIDATALAELIRAQGYTVTQDTDNVGDPMLMIEGQAQRHGAQFYDCVPEGCAEVQFRTYWQLEGKPVDQALNNSYMAKQRRGRAYVDGDGDLALEILVSAAGGITMEHVMKQHKAFLDTIRVYDAMVVSKIR